MSISFYIVALLLVGSIIYNIRFALIILKVQDSIEESLDVLDERYASISQILGRPLFYDSPEIRQVLQDIEQSRDAILYIANTMSRIEEVDESEPEEN